MMLFSEFLAHQVLAHVSGASGSGKTTIGRTLTNLYPDIIVQDLDEMDDQAVEYLGWTQIKKSKYTDEMLAKLASVRQELLDAFIVSSTKPIVLVGHHTEGTHVLTFPSQMRLMIDVSAQESAWRAYLRSQKEHPSERRKLEELPADEKEAQEVIDWLLDHGYKPSSPEEIIKLIGEKRYDFE